MHNGNMAVFHVKYLFIEYIFQVDGMETLLNRDGVDYMGKQRSLYRIP